MANYYFALFRKIEFFPGFYNISHMKVWGCPAYVKRILSDKLEAKFDKCLFNRISVLQLFGTKDVYFKACCFLR